MHLIHNLLKSWISFILTSCLALSLVLFPGALLSADIQLPADVSALAKKFSANYCSTLPTIGDPKKAVKVTARQMISELIFSGMMKKLMLVPKEDMATFVSTEIFDQCGSDLSISQKELNSYLFELAAIDADQRQSQPQPFKPFGVG